MKSLIFAVALAFSGGAATAQEEIFPGVIGAQIEAFQTDDFETAFGFAAPGIQGMFGTPDNFGRMVQQGYPMVWRPSSVDYLTARQTDLGWIQDIQVTDAAGKLHSLRYTMVQTADGWKIAGVQLLRVPDVGA